MLSVILVSWLCLCATGLGIAVTYTSGAGASGEVPYRWPLSEGLSAERMTLVMFAHPRCPCTQASVRELARLQRYTISKTETVVYLYAPAGEPDWDDSALREEIDRIPEVTIRTDLEGRLAERFGAMTSGHVVLYAPDGSLRFSGGITPGRGHEGDSTGARAIRMAVLQGAIDAAIVSVFGCDLQSPERVL